MKNESLDIALTRKPFSDRAMVIVETRPNFWLPWVIANAVRVVGWNLFVFATPEVFDLIDTKLQNVQYEKISVPLMNVNGYSQLLMSHFFWNTMRDANHVLIFQSDCVFVRPPREEHLCWSYIGGLCGSPDPESFTMNGGLSLRIRQDMLKAIGLMTDAYRIQPEDIAFTRIMRIFSSEFALPSIQDCHDFAIETIGNPNMAIGIHGTDKYYAATNLLKVILK